eukprot:12498829-Alexandrium_andersonii.AAC.1
MGGHITDNGTSRPDRVGALEPLVERSAEAYVANPIFPRADAFSGTVQGNVAHASLRCIQRR